MLGAALGGEADHGHSGFGETGDILGGLGGAVSELGQLVRGGVGVHGAVGEQQDAVLAEFLLRGDHDEGAGHGGDAGLGLDDLETGAQHVAGGVLGAGHHAVHIAFVDHHNAEIQLFLHGLSGLFDGHALLFTQLAIGLGEILEPLGSGGVHDLDAADVGALLGGDLFHFVLVAHQGHLADAFLDQDGGGGDGALFGAFGQDDALALELGFGADVFDKSHG